MATRLVPLVFLLSVLCAGQAGAISKERQCRQVCGGLIGSCTEIARDFGFGDLGRGCRQAVLKRCKREGPQACSTFCGDGTVAAGEACDGTDVGGKTCQGLGFASGTLACTASCGLDTSGCAAPPAPSCGNGVIESGEVCDGGNFGGRTCASEGFPYGGALSCTGGCALMVTSGCLTARFVDNGDGTVTDRKNHLMWEKKTGTVGDAVACGDLNACPNPHHVNNRYTWTSDVIFPMPTGMAFTNLLGRLNGSYDGVCFAGHCDWRLPTVEELQTILLEPFPCGTSPCIIDSAFGPTVASNYWSVTPEAGNPAGARFVEFDAGYAGLVNKDNAFCVRAVRSGS